MKNEHQEPLPPHAHKQTQKYKQKDGPDEPAKQKQQVRQRTNPITGPPEATADTGLRKNPKKNLNPERKKKKTGQLVPSGQNQNKRLQKRANTWQAAAAACSTDNQLQQ
ncbi:hypothetical protein ATANTOWER_028889 [Ataeniobius toweri]|uniref:Uncharacterized protein n=1 Tax=Ataeniobius toweri TaxID=208326 RepID=A0ABU7BVP9_9TELE|nr:hypothetical protein [Ataeniobius toweri]